MAQKAQQAYLSISTATGTPKNITGITKANPAVVSSTAHGQASGTIGIITGVLGMLQINNRAFVAYNSASPTPTGTFMLKGADTSILQEDGTTSFYDTYVSGGVWTPQTMTEVGEVRGISPLFDGEDADIDTSHLRSVGEESVSGLARFGTNAINLWLPTSVDTGQKRLRDLRLTGARAAFSVTLPSGLVAAFMARVKSFSVSGIEVDGAVQCSCALKNVSAPAFFA